MIRKNNNKQLNDILNDCFEKIVLKGESVESCLARYPQYSAELEPLLKTIAATQEASRITPSAEFRARARYQFRSALNENMTRKRQAAFAWHWRWATVLSTVGVLFLISTGSVMAASTTSMPGQPLYQVKLAMEQAQITLTPSSTAKARLYAMLADRRVTEIVYAAQSGNAELTINLTQQFTNDLSMVSSYATPARSLTFGDGSKNLQSPSVAWGASAPEQSGAAANTLTPTTTAPSAATPPDKTQTVTAPPAPTPTLVVTSPPQIAATQAQPAVTAPGYSSTISDATLLKLLQQYSAKNIAELMAILDKVPESVRAAVLSAIEAATNGYGQILGT